MRSDSVYIVYDGPIDVHGRVGERTWLGRQGYLMGTGGAVWRSLGAGGNGSGQSPRL